jgi:hypothetical protein
MMILGWQLSMRSRRERAEYPAKTRVCTAPILAAASMEMMVSGKGGR